MAKVFSTLVCRYVIDVANDNYRRWRGTGKIRTASATPAYGIPTPGMLIVVIAYGHRLESFSPGRVGNQLDQIKGDTGLTDMDPIHRSFHAYGD